LRGKDFLEQLGAVNSFFNRFPYKTHEDIYGTRSYWATPAEFMRNSGNCVDFAIIKYFALKQLGVDQNAMRITVLTDLSRDTPHAVLAVYHEDVAYILDNSTNMILPHTSLTHYMPQFSVNESFRWVHVLHPNDVWTQQVLMASGNAEAPGLGPVSRQGQGADQAVAQAGQRRKLQIATHRNLSPLELRRVR
jgi:hypothetical protein